MVQFIRGIDHVCGPDCRGSLTDGVHVEWFIETPDGPERLPCPDPQDCPCVGTDPCGCVGGEQERS